MLNGAGPIPNFNAVTNAAPVGRSLPPKPAATASPNEEALKTDQVTLSQAAQEARRLATAAQAVPEVRASRVQEARALLGSGGNAAAQNAKIAEKLLTEI
jgi:flagellar biosynthesis anti-sigma factor FlgM